MIDDRPTSETRRLLSLHLDGELDPTRQAALDARIDASEALQAELGFWKRFRERLAEDAAHTEFAPVSAEKTADAVMATIGARNREIATVLPFVRTLSAAAAVLLVVTGTVLAALALDTDPPSADGLDVRPHADLERSLVAPGGSVALMGAIGVESPPGDGDERSGR